MSAPGDPGGDEAWDDPPLGADAPADDRRQFVAATAALWLGAFVATALVLPPDPFTQLGYLLPLLVASPVVAYWLVYRDGAVAVAALFGRSR